MNDAKKQPRRGWVALRDLALISLAVTGMLWLGAVTNAYGGIFRWMEGTFHAQVDEVLVAVLLAALGVCVLALRLWRSGQREAAARIVAETTYRSLVEQVPVVVYQDAVDDNSSALYMSPQCLGLFGYTPEEWLADRDLWVDRLHPDDREWVLAESRRTNETGDPFVAEYRFLARDDRVVWVRDEAALLRDADGRPVLWQGVLMDITERKLAEERFRSLVETIPAVTYMQGAEPGDPVHYISPQVEDLLGYPPSEWTSSDVRLWRDVQHPDDRDRVLAADRRSDVTGQPFVAEYRLRHRDGRWIWVHDEATLIRDDAGRPLFWQGVWFDITAQRLAEERLREAEERYRTLVENMPAVTYVDDVDEDTTSIYVSPQVEKLFGYTPEEWKEAADFDTVHPEDRERFLAAIDRHNREGEPFDMEYRFRAKDGRWRWVSDSATVLRDEAGRIMLSHGFMYDITDRKEAEETLRSSEQREREAAERLRALDEMKNTFLAAVSHELRSPLTSILGLSLTLEYQQLPEEDRRDLTGRLAQNARKLDRLLKDLLDIDRLSRGIVTPQQRPTDLGELVRRTVSSLELSNRNVSVQAGRIVLPVDPAKIERIVENLVMNAVRHTQADATIWVRTWAEDGGAVLAVEDDGPGVPEHLRAAIFEPFRQGPTAAPHAPGTGIGLSLVWMFADLHGGRAWVQDREGGGASFRVFLPGTPPDAERADGDVPRRARRRDAAVPPVDAARAG